jgi:RND superfamily putative drug exporter
MTGRSNAGIGPHRSGETCVFDRLGATVYRFRYLLVVLWAAAAIACAVGAPSIASKSASDQSSLLPADVPSGLAATALENSFPGGAAAQTATISMTRDSGLTDADKAYLTATEVWVTGSSAPAEVRNAVVGTESATSHTELASALQSSDGKLDLLLVELSVPSAGDESSRIVDALRSHLTATAPAGLSVHVTGTAGITTDYLRAVKSGTNSATIVTIVLVLLLLFAIYRSPFAAFVPLATSVCSLVVARGVLGLLAGLGLPISSLLDTFLVVIVFGVGTDYSIFLISRFREELVKGADGRTAATTTVRRIGAVISASAGTVIVGLCAMAFGRFELISSTGPALAIAVAVTLLAGLTLGPALLAIFGRHIFWPRHTIVAQDAEPAGFFARLATLVSRHPGPIAAAIILLLLVPALYVPQMRTNFDTLAELPASSDARLGYDDIAAHLGKGKLAQATAIVTAPSSAAMLTPTSLAALRDTVDKVAAQPGIDSVTSLVTPSGNGVVPDALQPSKELGVIANSVRSASNTGGSSTSTGVARLLDPKVSDGLTQAYDYVGALGTAFPDVASGTEYQKAPSAIAGAQKTVAGVRSQTVVSTELRSLVDSLTSSGAAANTGGPSGASVVAQYLNELAAAYPEVTSLSSYTDATAGLAALAVAPTVASVSKTATALEALATYFDDRPAATLVSSALAGTARGKQQAHDAQQAFDAVPTALDGLARAFAGRHDDLFVPLGVPGADTAKVTDAVNAFVSADRSATRFYVTTTDDPYSPESFTATRSVEAILTKSAPSFGNGASALLAGTTAKFVDIQTVLNDDLVRVSIITVIGIVLVLMLLLRAVVAPIYLVATVILSFATSLGLSSFLFETVLGQPGVSYFLPLMVFVLLVSLGADYNIFLMHRVREESEHRPIRDGIRIASGRTGGVITSAGLILAGTFGSMATAPLVVLFQIGAAVALGVLIDTFVVRSILVPAITAVVGDRAWWPSRRAFLARTRAADQT